MDKNLIFVGGMPRSGSTLLQAILDQNPDFNAGVASGLLEILVLVRNGWDKFLEHQAIAEEISRNRKKETLKGIINGYYSNINQPYIFDKSRGWLAHIEMLEWVLERKVKIIVPVRDLPEILASFEILWRNTSKESQVSQENQNYLEMQTAEGRCSVWMRYDQPVGLAYNRIRDAVLRGYSDRLHFVEYDDLCNNTQTTLNAIYKFLDVPMFEHDFENVVKKQSENDRVHGLLNLHEVRPVITPSIHKAKGILGSELAKKYTGKYPW